MKEIVLTKGKRAVVDDADYEMLNKFNWFADLKGNVWYAGRRVGKSNQLMHRIILNPPEGFQTDHIDGDGLNNQRSNLRIVTARQNAQNLHIKKSSKFPGVSWVKNTTNNVWQSRIFINGKSKYLGTFRTEEDAFQRYKIEVNAL